ncbi:fimbrial biogenesis chaperone [Pseudomonas sp. Au-Pse12]|uniref:fimbrial biogenesis chaperone n=1 Tax=Pseudomonas sp. Au-Pse12 TaxID=2906459 RepID=UPI001E612D32|nr:molecular chaperone [Pseudomonas sp. Au-Pse12]MCE4056853.1 molecular chaperone [Pseudomonas sp. Au-Pse12]
MINRRRSPGLLATLCLTLASLWQAGAEAGLLASATRIVYPVGGREQVLEVSNTGATPVLVQSWVDDGQANAAPEDSPSPFVVLPAVFRLEPGARQSLKVLFNARPLPQDRESLFWLNLLEIPPTPTGAALEDRLILTVQTQMKILLRPTALGETQEQAAGRQVFTLTREAGRLRLHWHNPSPYHITLDHLRLSAPGTLLTVPGDLLAPYAKVTLDIQPTSGPGLAPGREARLSYQSIGDQGTPLALDQRLAVP